MIEIKRSCNSFVRNYPVQHKIIFEVFSIMINDDEWDLLDQFMQSTNTTPTEALQELLYAALWKFSYPSAKLRAWQ